MNYTKRIALVGGLFLITFSSFGQDDRSFWEKLFGKKADDINIEEPKTSQDSLATLLNNHLGTDTLSKEVKEEEITDYEISDTANPYMTDLDKGSLNINVDEKIKNWLDSAKSNPISGFRIQVYLGDLPESRRIRSTFLGQGERATLEYNSSDYFVRIGDFRSFMEAEKRLASLKPNYPSAFVVRDRIKLD